MRALRWRILGVVSVALAIAGAALTYDALVPARADLDCDPLALEQGGSAVALVERHRFLDDVPWLVVRDRAGATVRRERLPARGALHEAGDVIVMHMSRALPPETDDPNDSESFESTGTCILSRDDATSRFCTRGTEPLVDAFGAGDRLLEARGPRGRRSITAYRVADGTVAWTTVLPPEIARYHVSGLRRTSDDWVAFRVGERYWTIDHDTGDVVLASPRDATGICNEESILAASVGDEILVSLDHPVALRTLATPGPGTIDECDPAPDVHAIVISWCAVGSRPGDGRWLDVVDPTARIRTGCARFGVSEDLSFVSVAPAGGSFPTASDDGALRAPE